MGHVVYGQHASVKRHVTVQYNTLIIVFASSCGPHKIKSWAGFGPQALSLTPLSYMNIIHLTYNRQSPGADIKSNETLHTVNKYKIKKGKKKYILILDSD